MAKQKGLTLEDLLKSRESMKKEDISEAATGMRSIAAAISPSLAPIAESLGKLQQISEPVQSQVSQKSQTTRQVSDNTSVLSSINKSMTDTANSLKTLVTLNRTVSRSIEKTNELLREQVNIIKSYNNASQKIQEETLESMKRQERGLTGERPVEGVITTRAAEQADTTPGATQEAPQEGGKASPRSRMQRAGRIAKGAAIGGLVGTTLFSMASEDIKKPLQQLGIDEKAAGAIGAAIGAAIAADLPWKEMASAALVAAKQLGSLALALGPLGLAAGAAAVGLYKLDEYFKKLSPEEKENAAKAVNLQAALDPATAAQAIEEQVTSEQGKKDRLTREQKAATITRMGGSVWRALDMGGMFGGGTAEDYIRKEEEMVESGRARGLGKVGKEITLPTQPQVVTPYTEDISPERAQEIFRGTPLHWKKMTPEKRSEFLIAARSKGVMDINPDLTRATNTGFMGGSLRASEAETPPAIQPTTTPSQSSRLSTFNLASTEAGRNAAAPKGPTIIKGGDTINNITNTSRGGSGGAQGTPSRIPNPWDSLVFGNPWAAYP